MRMDGTAPLDRTRPYRTKAALTWPAGRPVGLSAGNWDQMSGSVKRRDLGFSGTRANLEAFILWKRCLV